MKVAVVGATGLVGSEILTVLAERNFPVTELIPVASEKSKGKEIEFKGKKYKVVTPSEAIALKPNVALFSAGGETSTAYAPLYAEAGITVVDNSSAWRMDPTKACRSGSKWKCPHCGRQDHSQSKLFDHTNGCGIKTTSRKI